MSSKDYYEPLELVKFDRIADDIIRMGRNLVIRINVNLARTVNSDKKFFYTEYAYTYNGKDRVSIKRGFEYYLSIETAFRLKTGRDKLFIKISPADYYAFMEAIKGCMEWFTSTKYRKLFVKNKGELVIGEQVIPSRELGNLAFGNSLTFCPTVIDFGQEFKPGVHIIINTSSDILDFDMSVDDLFGVYGALSNYNMFISAQTMVASLGIPLGTNRHNLSGGIESSIREEETKPAKPREDYRSAPIKGRQIGGKLKLEDL